MASLFFFPVLMSAQTPGFAISQRSVFGGTNDDFFSKIIPTSDGGYLLAGQSNSNNGDIIGYHGSWDIWVVKVNHNWQKQWSRCYGGSNKDDFKDIAEMADGNILLFGWTSSNDGDFTDYHGNVDAFVIKLSTQGTILAKKSFGGSASETNYLNFITVTDGSIYLAISTNSNDGDVSGNHGGFDFWVLKLNPDLSIAWNKCFGGSGDDTPIEIIKTQDGNLLVCGGTSSTDGDVTGLHGSKEDFWVVKLSQTGSILWQKVLGGTETDFATCMSESSSGDYIIGGQTYSNNGDVTGQHGTSADGWVCSLTPSGILKWNRCYGGSSVETIYKIKSINGVDFILESPTYSTNGDVIGGHPGLNSEADVWILRINGNNGVIAWQKSLGGSLNEDYYDMNVNSNGAVTVLMTSTSSDGDLAGIDGYQKASGWLVKLNNLGSIDQQLRFGSFPGDPNHSSEGFSLYKIPGVNSMIIAGKSKFQGASYFNDDITISKGGIDGMLIRVGDFNIIKSRPFRDLNKNNIRDGNEPFVVNGIQLSTAKVGDSMVVFYKNNFFTSIVDTGRYVHNLISSRYTADSGIKNSVFTSYNTVDSFEFAVQPILSRISGYVFIDKNHNNIKDSTEPYASNVKVVSKRGNDSTTNLLKNGFYYNLVDTGLYTTKIYIQSDEYTILPDSAVTNVVDY
ncbi:MAG: hypothetical protein ACKVOW_13580, partial [Chitinophagaceae bacterium]